MATQAQEASSDSGARPLASVRLKVVSSGWRSPQARTPGPAVWRAIQRLMKSFMRWVSGSDGGTTADDAAGFDENGGILGELGDGAGKGPVEFDPVEVAKGKDVAQLGGLGLEEAE